MTLSILLASFMLLLLLRLPVGFCIGLSALVTMWLSLPFDPAVITVAQRMGTGITNFALLAIPFFILAGKLMAGGGIARRLIDFAKVVAGPIPGALAITNILSTMLFGAVSGSATAAASGVGGFMIPAMEKENYDRRFATALTATSCTAGLLIPPSNVLIVYAMVAGGVSVGTLFVAGYIPGILLSLSLIPVAIVMTLRGGYGVRTKRATLREFAVASLRVIPSLFMIVLVMGGIIIGLFTATEAAAVAVIYAFLLAVCVYREVKPKDLPVILAETAATTGVIFLLVGTSMAMGWIFAYAQVPQLIGEFITDFSDNPWVVLLVINIILLGVGTFMDTTPAVLIFTPIFLPILLGMADAFGMPADHIKYQFGIIIVLNLCIGLCTPPVGAVLFIGCGVGKVGISEVVRPMIPLFIAMLFVLMLVSFVPALSTWLPSLLGML